MPIDDAPREANRILHSQQFIDDPESLFAPLRTHHPVCPVRTSSGRQVWLISRDEDVRALLGDERLIMTGAYGAGASGTRNALDRNLLDLDGAEHTAVRRLAAGALSARAVSRHRDLITRIIATHAERLPVAEPIELITAFIRPATLASTCTVLGLPEADWPAVEGWVRALLSPRQGTMHVETALEALEPYLRDLVRKRRELPQDDVLSAISSAECPDDVTENDIVSLCGMLVIASFENTGRTIANAVHRFVRHPGEFSRYATTDPAERHVLLEDLIRVSLPEPLSSVRVAARPVQVGDHVIRTGERVMFAFGAANHDERRYPDPAWVAPRRNAPDHLSFGKGAHFCLGAALARTQIAVTLDELVRRFADIHLVNDRGPVWQGTYRHRELVRLDVRLLPLSQGRARHDR
ncbi:cytochrome P450 [Streptomyces sp. bgisy100]|uniref:cytochrome P450 n=1 Tax=Streptomyces sp. bgisy100 TaxID=3413783 RepID=UPI003D738FD3